jgi:hypothetical protein
MYGMVRLAHACSSLRDRNHLTRTVELPTVNQRFSPNTMMRPGSSVCLQRRWIATSSNSTVNGAAQGPTPPGQPTMLIIIKGCLVLSTAKQHQKLAPYCRPDCISVVNRFTGSCARQPTDNEHVGLRRKQGSCMSNKLTLRLTAYVNLTSTLSWAGWEC